MKKAREKTAPIERYIINTTVDNYISSWIVKKNHKHTFYFAVAMRQNKQQHYGAHVSEIVRVIFDFNAIFFLFISLYWTIYLSHTVYGIHNVRLHFTQ